MGLPASVREDHVFIIIYHLSVITYVLVHRLGFDLRSSVDRNKKIGIFTSSFMLKFKKTMK